ncbi:receptor-type tyrosine-protein phosphatase H-like isoform X7 [Cyclopterus lumpus]|uniref:receptor-type tyrosine-protein phosphatase H-like isoform X7 n=1 Tax=Cyclopterus lumpus TaxID=8103 RepID=UPI001487374F|nr:receptor-type tyrosine-protein phosphatase H-like isoform X7 [Cyclopterus lumpus]
MTMKPLSFKITSHHFLLCVFLSRLWFVTNSTVATSDPTPETATTPLTTFLTTQSRPGDVHNVTVVTQNEISITLKWDKVNTISTYFLHYVNEGGPKEKFISERDGGPSVTHVVTTLTAGRKYDFILITYQVVNSTGYSFEAVTAPGNAHNVTVSTQSETSITLEWDKVNDILNYIIVMNGREINVTASAGQGPVSQTISELTSGTKYDFTLFTVFENVRSSGVNITAPTAPGNAHNVTVSTQSETSITLEWDKVNDILNYIIVMNGREINVTASAGQGPVSQTISELTSGTKYDFTLFTVFENVRSSGVNITAPTAPPNAQAFQSVAQSETSITLEWDKVNDILYYIIVLSGSEINVTASAGQGPVSQTISELTSGNKYDFTLFTVFENVRSSGVNITAPTAPGNAHNVTVSTQSETSITLEWDKVNDILNYIIVMNGREINVTASAGQGPVSQTISELTSGTKYDFTLFTVFENVRSSGVNITAPTAPPNAQAFQSVAQSETSITLEWDKVNDILYYIIVLSGSEINVTASAGQGPVSQTISELTSGTKYDFTLFTVFENVRSSGVNITAPTAPPNAQAFQSVAQSETSITLEWDKVNDILNYIIVLSGSEINVTASAGQGPVSQTISELTSGMKYDFTLFTVFENVRSSGVNISAPTAPGNVNTVTVSTQNETSITLEWDKVNDISSYALQYDSKEDTINILHQDASVKHEVYPLKAGKKYDFTLITLFEKVNSTGFSFNAATVPSMVTVVNVTERSVTNLTLTWRTNKNWNYSLQINGASSQLLPNGSIDVMSHSIVSLQPGTEYPFSVTTVFSGLNSTAYKGFTVTAIDCTNGTWRVTNSSIQGTIEGLFSNASATYESQTHVSPGRGTVSFVGLHPGATYEVSLVYETNSIHFLQCSHSLTILPPSLSAHCEYWDAGYSIFIAWNKPAGVWTSVEVNVTGRSYTVHENEEQHFKIPGFQPANTYEVSLASLSGTVRSYEPFVFSCLTDPRGVIAGAVFAVGIFGLLVCLAVFFFIKRPDIISRKRVFKGGSRQSSKKCKAIPVAKFPDHFYQLGVDENRGFSQEYESFIPVGVEQTREAALLPQNKPRNRFNNVLPYDWCRVKLSASNPNETSDYINACYIPGYNNNREYIATQGPLPSTVNEFWKMIWEQRVKGIVMVTNCTEGGRTKCERYWPADRKPCSYGELVVTIRSEQREPEWTLREFRVKHGNTSEEHTVRHFHFTAWPDHGVPQGTEILIQFRGLVRRHIESDGAEAPTVVHCSAGVGRTGTIIALDVLLQQLEKEKAVGINGFVHKMRLSRPHMVQTESQYVFLHQCIMDRLQLDEKNEEHIYENEEHIYENEDMIYANATALQMLTKA